MSNHKKLDEIEEMFQKTSKPKTVIEKTEIDEITKMGCIFDHTKQGENALLLATELAKKLHLPLKVYVSDDYYLKMKASTDDIRNKEKEMTEFIEEFTKEEEVSIKVESLIGGKIQKVLKIMEDEIVEEEKLSRLLINNLIDENFRIFVVGAPMLRTLQDKGHLGYYLSILLKDHDIHSNFLIVPDELIERGRDILGITKYNQKSGTINAIIRRALSFEKFIENIKIVGLIEDNTVEIIAKSELTEENQDLEIKMHEVRQRIINKFSENINEIVLGESYELNIENEIVNGVITSEVKILLEKYNPKLVLIRSVSKLAENLDQDAEVLARIALTEGYPVLILWD